MCFGGYDGVLGATSGAWGRKGVFVGVKGCLGLVMGSVPEGLFLSREPLSRM